MEAGAAEAYARQELEQGRIPRVLPMMRAPTPGEAALERQAQQYEVDQTASGIETAIKAVQRIGKAGELALGKAGGGMQLFLGEMSGADVSGVKDKLGYIAAFNQAMGENPYKPLQIIESAGTSIVQQLPALVAGAITGSQPLVLASMYANSFGDTYADGRERGLDKADSTARAAIFGAFEVLGEKFGLGASLDLIKGAAKGKSLSELAGYFAKQITKEIPGEQLTYAGQFATDKGFGLNPEAGIEEFLRGAAETAIVTATQAGMMLGGAAATSKALRAVGGVRYTPEAPPSVAPPTAPPIPPAPPAQKEPARPAERIEPTIDMGELERVAAGMPERAEPPLEGGRAPIQKMFDELKQVSGLTAEAPPAEAPPVEPAPPPAPPRIEAPPAELLSFEEQIRALEEKQKSLLTKAGKVPAVKSPARKKYDALGEQINALRGQVETPAAPEAPAPTPPVAEAPKVEPPKEAPAAPKPEAPKETPAKETKPPLLDESNVQRSKKPPEQGGRHPQVQAAAMLLEKGQMTREEYEKYVDAYRPIYSIDIDKMYPPSTPEKMRDALRGDVAKSRLNTPIADGTRVGLRMDLPALDKGVPVVSIHEGKPNEDPRTGEPYASAGDVIGYGSTGYIKDVFFAPRSQEKSLKMGYMPSGKNPLQTAEGKWVNMSPEQVLKRVKELKDDPAWTQVGFDPHRHGYFYDRKTRQPVAKADEMFQIGNFLLAKNVQYAPKEQFLYNIESILDEPVGGDPDQRSQSYKREAKKLTKAYEDGKISSEQFAGQMGILKRQDDQQRASKEEQPLARGPYHIKRRLNEAIGEGWISKEAYDLAEWFINNNPRLVEGLAISLQGKGQRSVVGTYDVFNRLMILIKNKGNDKTIIHEILHHLERMMPQKVQDAIRKEWTKRLLDAQKQAKTELEKFFFDALIDHHFGDNRIGDLDAAPKMIAELNKMGFDFNLNTSSSKVVKEMLKRGTVPIKHYQYYSPSEFWAINGSDIVRGRYDAIKGGLLTRLKNWLRELGEKIKSIFGLKSEAALIRALDSLAKADGKFVTKQILDQTQVAYGIEPEKKQTDTPEFKRWFGDSKVVDENGEPLVVYRGMEQEIQDNRFRVREDGGTYGPGIYASTNPQVASFWAGDREAEGMESDFGGSVYPVYISLQNPADGGTASDIEAEFGAGARDEMIRRGYDGVMADGGEIVAFYPEQIKSATGNIGTFDPTDPNILYSIEPDRKAAPKKMIEPAKIDRLRESWTVGRDELGRPNFGPGAKAYDTVARITNVVLDKILMKPISPELGRAMRNMKVEIDKAQKKVATLGKELSKLSSQERELISDVIEGELKADVIPPQHIIDIAASMVEIMSAQGQEMMRLGMLSKEAFMRWENKYLPRFYLNNLGKEAKAWATATKRLLMKQPTMQGIKGQQLKSRGMYQQIYTEDLPDWIAQGWEQRDADFDPKTSVETVVWRDYTREEREEMGEIRDAMFRFVMGYNASQRDIALGRLYESLSENYASKSPIEGYVRVPETMVEGTNVNRYGKLAGMYVPKEIMDHLVWNDKAMSNGLYKLYQAGLGRWKEGKTVLNPTAHANNVFSNFTMAHFAGVSYWDVEKYAGALKDFVTNDEMLKEAEDIGLFTGTFSQTEMVENMPAELKQLANMTGSQLAKYGDKAWDLLSLTLEWDGKKYGVRPMMKWMYENEDFFFRYLIYRDARNRGMEPEDAREYSNQFIFTYDDLPAGARVVRDIGMPFFSYTYKVVPVLARTALEYPWRFAAPAAAVYTLNALMYSIAASVGGDEDDWWGKTLYKYVTDKDFRQKANQLEEEERKNLPSWMKGKSSLGTEKAIRLGMDDITGLPLFLDISRIFPGGDLLDAENNAGGLALLQPLTPSNPVLTSLVAMLANKDMFLGKDVVLATDTDAEKARKRAAWLWKQWAPSISVGNYHFDRGMNTIANMTGKPITVDAGPMGVIDYTGIGKDGLPVIPKYAALQTFGVKVRPYDLEVSAAIEKSKQDRLIKELAIEIKRINRLEEKGSISPAAAELLRSQAQNKQELLKDGLTVEGKPKK